MKKELFADLMKSMGEALEHAQGKRELRTTVLPEAPAAMTAADIRALRDRQNASQAVFARYLNVSTQLVQAWEANRRHPEGAALRLLEVAVREPDAVFVVPSMTRKAPLTAKRSRSAPARKSARRKAAARAK